MRTHNDGDSGAHSPKGLFEGLIESIKAHVDERLKSPFGGAFVIAWVAINWRLILYLMLSKERIEDRIQFASEVYISPFSIVLEPLALAVAVTIGFYAFSLIFLYFLEFYRALRSKIEQKFDAIIWISPNSYISYKRKNLDRLRQMTELASDNQAAIDAEREKLMKSEAERLSLADEIGVERNKFLSVSKELEVAREALSEAVRSAKSANDRQGDLQENLRTAYFTILDLLPASEEPSKILRRPMIQNSEKLNGDLKKIRDFLMKSVSLDEDLLAKNLSIRSMEEYTQKKYPALRVNPELQERLWGDLKRGNFLARLGNLQDLDDIVGRASGAVVIYSAERPDLFTSGTDYITKSIGFIFPEFRKIHGFGQDTINAFSKYQQFVSPMR